MKDIFINKSGVGYTDIAGTWELDTLAVGAVGAFNQDGALLVSGGAGPDYGDYIQLYTMLPNGETKKSVKLYSPAKLSNLDYSDAVAGVKSLGAFKPDVGSLNQPTALTPGTNVSFAIRDLSKETFDETSLDIYSFPVSVSDDQNSIVAKAVAEVNARSTAVVTAAAITSTAPDYDDGILFTGKTAGVDFMPMVMQGVWQDADVCELGVKNGKIDANMVAPLVLTDGGQGTYSQILNAEEVMSTRDGNTRSQVLTNYMWSVPQLAEEGVEYDQLVLTHVSHMSDELMRENNPKQVLTVTGVTADIATLKGILEGFVAGLATPA